MTNKVWEGHERREHDAECKERIKSLKEWVAQSICIATKPGKAKQAMMWAVMTIMLSAALGSAFKTVSSAQTATEIHTRNTNDIAHVKEEMAEVKDDHKELVGTVNDMAKTQNRMDRNLSRLLGALDIPAEEPKTE